MTWECYKCNADNDDDLKYCEVCSFSRSESESKWTVKKKADEAERVRKAEEEKRRREEAIKVEEEKRRREIARKAEEEKRKREIARKAEEEKRKREEARKNRKSVLPKIFVSIVVVAILMTIIIVMGLPTSSNNNVYTPSVTYPTDGSFYIITETGDVANTQIGTHPGQYGLKYPIYYENTFRFDDGNTQSLTLKNVDPRLTVAFEFTPDSGSTPWFTLININNPKNILAAYGTKYSYTMLTEEYIINDAGDYPLQLSGNDITVKVTIYGKIKANK